MRVPILSRQPLPEAFGQHCKFWGDQERVFGGQKAEFENADGQATSCICNGRYLLSLMDVAMVNLKTKVKAK